MDALAHLAGHAFGEEDRMIAVFVPDAVSSRESLCPFIALISRQERHLCRRFLKVRRVYAKKANLAAGLPVIEEKLEHSGENLGIDSRGLAQRMRAGNGGEVRVAQLDLDGTR